MPAVTLPDTGIPAAATAPTTTPWTAAWRTRCALLLRVLLFWITWFAVARLLFFGWHWDLVPDRERALVPFSFAYGARMDLSAAAYVTTVYWLALLLMIASF